MYVLCAYFPYNVDLITIHFQAIFRHLMVLCGVSPVETGYVAALYNIISLSAVEMSSVETIEEHPSPYTNILTTVTTVSSPLGLVDWWKLLLSILQDLSTGIFLESFTILTYYQWSCLCFTR